MDPGLRRDRFLDRHPVEDEGFVDDDFIEEVARD
jgi:hypothetical protein